eukprot:gb/GFBE01031500.1/.p1 GENE.gb/GFBE01031500.1/~~gb/GFBE01031500.1/.p1  ORF type:complete len:1157 (+),score=242.02 gb/GFBE01031500.1/:1-3471(+)
MAETIKVAVRVRPLVPRELDSGASIAVAIHNHAVTVNAGAQQRTFGFDHAYWSVDPKDPSYASQDQLNNDIGKPCLENMIKGYNFCVFAYGQTGAGKTHTLSSSKDKNVGLIPFVLEGLFTQHRAKFKNDELRIWISFMEIYNEQIRDLLSPGREPGDLKVMDHPELGAYVPGLTEAPCREITDVKKLLDFGTKKRVTAATNMNAGSSRSHAVFTIRAQRLTGPKPTAGKADHRKSLSARVNLVDLAGSERIARSGADGLRLREGCAINQSLTALGLVIKQIGEAQREGRKRRTAVDERTKAIPFRASRLTFLLRESLAGNSKTFMVAAISPASTSADETVSTLRFATSVKRVKTVALQNVDKKEELVANLQAEVKRLTEMLETAGPEGAGDVTVKHLHDDIAERERLLTELSKSHAQRLAEAKLLQAMREEVLKDMGLTQQDLAQTIGIDKDVPYLLNMNEDPALSGKMMYFLPLGQPITVGANQDNKIVLQGPGMPDHLCQIEHLDEQGVVVRIPALPAGAQQGMSVKARVCVNGSAIKESEQRKLKHNDKLFLGRASALRLIVPEAARALGQAGAVLLEREQDAELLRGIVPEDSRAWAELQLYLEDLRHRLGEESGQEIFQTLVEASNLVDEANEITMALRPEDRLKFEVELVWDVHRAARDIVVIRLMKGVDRIHEEEDSPCSHASDAEQSVVTAYWTLVKLKARLDQMRDCFDEKQSAGRWEGRGDCLRDPWMEPSIVELRHRLVAHIDVESQRRNIHGSIRSVRAVPATSRYHGRASMAGSLASMMPGSRGSIESLASHGSQSGAKARQQPASGSGRRQGHEVPSAPRSARQRPKDSLKASSDKVSQPIQTKGSHDAAGSQGLSELGLATASSAAGSVLKEELNDVLRAQLREKDEKEELYRLRIEYLQQQIDIYRQYAKSSTSPQMPAAVATAPARPDAMRARSSSPGLEPRTAETRVRSVTIPPMPISARSGPSTVRSLSARDGRTSQPTMSLELQVPQRALAPLSSREPVAAIFVNGAIASRQMPSLLTSAGTTAAAQISLAPSELKANAVRVSRVASVPEMKAAPAPLVVRRQSVAMAGQAEPVAMMLGRSLVSPRALSPPVTHRLPPGMQLLQLSGQAPAQSSRAPRDQRSLSPPVRANGVHLV